MSSNHTFQSINNNAQVTKFTALFLEQTIRYKWKIIKKKNREFYMNNHIHLVVILAERNLSIKETETCSRLLKII